MSSLEFVCKQVVGILDAIPKLGRGQETDESFYTQTLVKSFKSISDFVISMQFCRTVIFSKSRLLTAR